MKEGKPKRQDALRALRRMERAAALEALGLATNQFETAKTMHDKITSDIARFRAAINRPIRAGVQRAAELITVSVERSRRISDLEAAEKTAQTLEAKLTESETALLAAKDQVARAQQALVALDMNNEPSDRK